MPLNIPSRPSSIGIPRNIGKIGVPQNIGRAQSTQTGMINQKVDRQNARVSMNQVLSAQAEERGQKTTSINRVGVGGTVAHTSVARYQTNIKTSVNDTTGYNQDAAYAGSDEKRYEYIRRLVKQRKAKEQALKEIANGSNSPLSVGTGTSMARGGVGGFHKQVGKFFKSNSSQFGGLSSSQKAVLEDTIENTLEHKATGSSITRYDKMDMKKKIAAAKSQGQIGATTAKKFKGIISKLG